MKPYNGHPSWAYWNVALWLANDEALYSNALYHMRNERTLRAAARAFVEDMLTFSATKTPDGARYSLRAVEHALRCLKDGAR